MYCHSCCADDNQHELIKHAEDVSSQLQSAMAPMEIKTPGCPFGFVEHIINVTTQNEYPKNGWCILSFPLYVAIWIYHVESSAQGAGRGWFQTLPVDAGVDSPRSFLLQRQGTCLPFWSFFCGKKVKQKCGRKTEQWERNVKMLSFMLWMLVPPQRLSMLTRWDHHHHHHHHILHWC